MKIINLIQPDKILLSANNFRQVKELQDLF